MVSIILGYLRIGKVAPVVSVLAKEISTAMTTTGKQTLIEAVSESDSKSDSLIGSSVQMAIPHLSTDLWIKMISQLGQRLVQLLEHIKVTMNYHIECTYERFVLNFMLDHTSSSSSTSTWTYSIKEHF